MVAALQVAYKRNAVPVISPEDAIVKNRRYRRNYAKISGAALMMAYCLSSICYQQLPQKPFPLFHWNLYSLNSNKTGYYDIVITAFDHTKELDHPVFLADLKSQYHQDWDICPFKITQRFGREVTGQASEAALKKTKKLIENFLIDYPVAHYDLIFAEYSQYDVFRSGKYSLPSQIPFRVIRSFQKDDKE